MQMNHQDNRNHKVKCDYGKADYYRSYAKNNKSAIDKDKYYQILDDYLNLVHNMIGEKGMSYEIPQRLGKIQLRKIKNEIKVNNDGTIKNNLGINWKETKKLWFENPRAKEKKIKIRYINKHTDGYVFKLVYVKYNANYKNKTVYKLAINREMRRLTHNIIITGKIDAFLLNS